MSMSRDRVVFTIPEHRLTIGKEAEVYAEVLFEIFNINVLEFCYKGDIEITCRPSQFARFVIRRFELGGQNLIKELNPKLVGAKPARGRVSKVDASKVPAR